MSVIISLDLFQTPILRRWQANSLCHAELAELNALRRERDKLALELVDARTQLTQCDTALGLINQPAQEGKEASQPSKEDKSRTAHITYSSTPQGVPGKSSRPSRGGPSRSLHWQKAESVELHCSKADVDAMSLVAADVSKAKAFLSSLTTTNAGCAECLQTCAQHDYRIGCLFRCQHQRENQCTDADTTKIASMIPTAALQDRRLLVLMIEQVSASCAYCILETVESVCGVGCVQETMHITTDYPILPRPCLSELAAVLQSQPPVPQPPMECSAPSPVIAAAETDGDGVVQLNIPASASPRDVACILAERFRRADGDASANATTLTLPAGMGPITMLADLIVNPGETVRIQADPGTRLTLVVGERQLQVRRIAHRGFTVHLSKVQNLTANK